MTAFATGLLVIRLPAAFANGPSSPPEPASAPHQSTTAPANDSLHAENTRPAEAAATSSEEAHSSDRVDPIHHVVDSRTLEIPWPNARLSKEIHLPSLGSFTIGSLKIEMAITKHTVFLWIAALFLLVVVVGIVAPRARGDSPPHGLHNLFESVIVFLRDEVAIPALGPHYGRKLLPYLLSVFFFILTCNLMGLFPYASTATGNISVTAGLAVLSFFLIQGVAIKEAGFLGWLKHLTGGVHWIMWPIMVPVEILGLFTKPFALCIRLFANMTAGHIVILSLLGLIFIFHHAAVAAMSVPFSLFIMLLEILVAFIQAYIFTILTAVFTGLGVHSHHGEGRPPHEGVD